MSVTVARLAILARSKIAPSSVGVGAAKTRGETAARPFKMEKNFILNALEVLRKILGLRNR